MIKTSNLTETTQNHKINNNSSHDNYIYMRYQKKNNNMNSPTRYVQMEFVNITTIKQSKVSVFTPCTTANAVNRFNMSKQTITNI